MNETWRLTACDLSGLYELSRDGLVLYARSRQENQSLNTIPHLVGFNFFEQIADFDNVGELRRQFNKFVTGSNFTEKLVFDCLSQTKSIQFRVMMVRAYENNHPEPGSIVILDIRKNSH